MNHASVHHGSASTRAIAFVHCSPLRRAILDIYGHIMDIFDMSIWTYHTCIHPLPSLGIEAPSTCAMVTEPSNPQPPTNQRVRGTAHTHLSYPPSILKKRALEGRKLLAPGNTRQQNLFVVVLFRKGNIAIKNCFRVEAPEINPLFLWTSVIRTHNVVQISLT